jgi:hypothetical protein
MSKLYDYLQWKMLISNPYRHGNFLFQLSYLEQYGAIRIAQTQVAKDKSSSSLFLLKHWNEETRHALFFKKWALKISQYPSCDKFKLIPGCKNFLMGLELKIYRMLRDNGYEGLRLTKGTYALTTLIIELRAKEFYSYYEKILRELAMSFSVKGILEEEEGHLNEIEVLAEECLGEDFNHFFLTAKEWEKEGFEVFTRSILHSIH